MLYTPMLPEAASGTLEPRHVVVPLRMMCPHADLVLGRAFAHDPERQRVQVRTGEGLVNLRYQNLVVALGAVARALPIPGLAEHALGFKSLADAIALRNHVLRRLEAAAAAPNEAHRERELTFVFVGAGYAGVEALAELSDLVRDALRYYPSLRETRQHWVLVDAAPKILPEPPPYRYRMLGQVATLGRYKGIADVLGLRLRGFPGWFVTRTYHLYQLPLLSRKLRVVTDWTTSLFFRRDIAELGMLGHPQPLGDV